MGGWLRIDNKAKSQFNCYCNCQLELELGKNTVLFILSFSLGMGPLCFVLLGDFSLPRLAALAGTISGLTNWGSAFLTTFVYSDMERVFGLAGTFWFTGHVLRLERLFL